MRACWLHEAYCRKWVRCALHQFYFCEMRSAGLQSAQVFCWHLLTLEAISTELSSVSHRVVLWSSAFSQTSPLELSILTCARLERARKSWNGLCHLGSPTPLEFIGSESWSRKKRETKPPCISICSFKAIHLTPNPIKITILNDAYKSLAKFLLLERVKGLGIFLFCVCLFVCFYICSKEAACWFPAT